MPPLPQENNFVIFSFNGDPADAQIRGIFPISWPLAFHEHRAVFTL
jgi:hypothetical protein